MKYPSYRTILTIFTLYLVIKERGINTPSDFRTKKNNYYGKI